MADVNAIGVALATRLATTGLRAHGTAPGQVVPPAVVVIPSRPAILYGQTMDGETTLNLLAIVLLSAANDTSGQTGLNAAISSSGTKSIAAAVQADPTLAGTVESALVLQVSTYGLVEYAGQQYLGATFLVQCFTHLLSARTGPVDGISPATAVVELAILACTFAGVARLTQDLVAGREVLPDQPLVEPPAACPRHSAASSDNATE